MRKDILIAYGIKMFFINIYTYCVLRKMLNYNKKDNYEILVIINVIVSIICTIVRYYTNSVISIAILYLLFNIIIFLIHKINTSLLANTVSFSICIILLGLSIMLSFIPYRSLYIKNEIINLLVILVIEGILIRFIFKLKRFQKGVLSLSNKGKNDFVEIVMLNISIIIIFVYCLLSSYNSNSIVNLVIAFIILGVIMFIMIQKTLILYYKQKLLEKTLEENKQEIANKDKQIQELQNEKFKISKVSHEFYNRQKALELAVKEYISNTKAEASNEIAITNKINELSKEYSGKIEKIKTPEKLPLTGINEIDRMFKYMQSECENNKIDFNLQINCNIFYMVNNLISKNRLETLIGDHIRDAIIAVNHSPSKNKSIIAIIGIKEGSYEFSVYDTGIEFEIDTLIKLGLEPTTTHKESGGTGIGFITTFETMEETKASLIIEEKQKITENDYTKSISIRFDGKHQYTIKSYRAEEIEKKNKTNRIIIKKL